MADQIKSLEFQDLDDVELIYAVEDAFGIRIRDQEAESSLRVGDLYDLIANKLGASDGRRNACLSAVVFYRLRVALNRNGQTPRLHRDTPVDQLLPLFNQRLFWRGLGNKTGLKLPSLCFSGLCWILMSLGFFIGLATSISTSTLLPAFFGLAAAIVFGLVLPGKADRRWSTMEGLVGQVVAHNFGSLSREFRTTHPDDLWDALVRILRYHSPVVEGGEITRETTFFKDSRAGSLQ